MTDTRYLVHGVFWDGQPAPGQEYDGGSPVLRLQPPSGRIPGGQPPPGCQARLPGGRPAAGPAWGTTRSTRPARRDHVLCPASRSCRQRASSASAALCWTTPGSSTTSTAAAVCRPGCATYLMQQHWLYVATFAGGASKVGTASHLRKWNRLAEQGAVVARYVARAEDGRVVRILEDMVTQEAGLTQQVRSAAKEEALVQPLSRIRLDAINARHAAAVRALLARAAVERLQHCGRTVGAAGAGSRGSANPRRGTPTRTRSTAAGTVSASRPSAERTPWHGWTERTPPLW